MNADPSDRLGLQALYRSLRDGRAGFAPRLALSAAALAIALGGMFMVLGLAEQGRRIRDEQVFLGMAGAAAAWLASLYVVWATYSRWRRALSTGFTCAIILVTTIAVCIAFGTTLRSPEFFIAGTITLAIAAMVVVISAAAHQAARGRALLTLEGSVDVRCPGCGYSMAGLGSAACPECGVQYTLDQLIAAQDYEGVRQRLLAAGPTTIPPAPIPSQAAAQPAT